MAKKTKKKLPRRKGEITYRGYTIPDLKKMSLQEFTELLPASQRRKINRGFTEDHKKLIQRVKDGRTMVRTHLRDMIILPEMIGIDLEIHDGKKFNRVTVQPEMLGHYVGEYSLTRNVVRHGSAGVGATRSSKFVPLK
ncbi:MAG: 30S ribosomal protein S19 [Candidatus Methanogaster sp.]|uniref:30S ribosomal protein S19 n=1 Tax=Candidatus Methanogaster sp. TaxID=3386292 RepID=A0AC61L4U3_9EURY|nr:MAG: 30S ribosomal protein S19 [ANME-2 cluster archaeon]